MHGFKIKTLLTHVFVEIAKVGASYYYSHDPDYYNVTILFTILMII